MAISKLEAIQSLHPTAQFVLRGDELTWQSDDITEAEFEALLDLET